MEKRMVRADDLYSYQWLSDPQLNENFNKIAYVVKEIDRENDNYKTFIQILNLSNSQTETINGLTSEDQPKWSDNGRFLGFTRMTAIEGTDKKAKQIWMKSAETEEEQQITSFKKGVGTFEWSPCGKYILFSARTDESSEQLEKIKTQLESESEPGTIVAAEKTKGIVSVRSVPKLEGSGWRDGLYTHLFLLELATGSVQRLTFGAFDATQPFWSPAGTEISFITRLLPGEASGETRQHNKEEQIDIDLVEYNDMISIDVSDWLSGGIANQAGQRPVMRRITDSTLGISYAGYTPDGQQAILIANDRRFGGGTHNQLFAVDLQQTTDEGRIRAIHEPYEIQIGNTMLGDMKATGSIQTMAIREERGQLFIYVLGTWHGEIQMYRVAMDGSCEAVTTGEQEVYQFQLAKDSSYMIAAISEALLPCDLFRIELENAGEEKTAKQRLTELNKSVLDSFQLSEPQMFWFNNNAGQRLQGWIMYPPHREEGKKYPMLLQIHGGPHAMYGANYSHEFQLLAAQGNIVLYMNPHGSSGYGQQFAVSCQEAIGERDYEDLIDAVDYALQAYSYIDDARLGVGGGSYGGFMTNWIVGHTNRFKAAITDRSISNWISFYGVSDIGMLFTENLLGDNPWRDPMRLWEKSPLAYAEQMETPLLIIHGELDYRCPVGQAEELYIALKRQGKTTEMVRFPKSNHALHRAGIPSLRVERLERMINWYKEYL